MPRRLLTRWRQTCKRSPLVGSLRKYPSTTPIPPTILSHRSAPASEISPLPRKPEWPLMADNVAKVENRTTPKISRKSILSRRYDCNALHRRYEDRWSLLYEMMWSLHVAARETHQRSLKFSFFARKRLFQHYRHETDMPGRPDDVCS